MCSFLTETDVVYFLHLTCFTALCHTAVRNVRTVVVDTENCEDLFQGRGQLSFLFCCLNEMFRPSKTDVFCVPQHAGAAATRSQCSEAGDVCPICQGEYREARVLLCQVKPQRRHSADIERSRVSVTAPLYIEFTGTRLFRCYADGQHACTSVTMVTSLLR